MKKTIVACSSALLLTIGLRASVDPLNLCSLVEQCKEAHVSTVDFIFTDLHATVRSITVPLEKAAHACAQGLAFDGSSVAGCTDIFASDMHLAPDLSTFTIVPTDTGTTARVLCDVCLDQDTPYQADPRTVLKQHLDHLRDHQGCAFLVGPELEFFLFKYDCLQPIDSHSYCRAQTDAQQKMIIQELLRELHINGINVEKLHHEVASGQYEISIAYGDALMIADQIVIAKHVIQSFAHSRGLRATFMPKPLARVNGSGMHVHCSVYDLIHDRNLFFDSSDAFYLSEYGKQFTAGILHHIPAISAFTNPTINSYKRLVAGYEAPVYICWSRSNRSALVRVPVITAYQPKAARIELRSSDAMANPYLLFALLLEAGLDGVAQKKEVPASVDHDVYKLTGEQLLRKGIRTIPHSLEKAIEHLANDLFVSKVLGEKCVSEFVKAKRQEIAEYNLHISQWEIDHYLA